MTHRYLVEIYRDHFTDPESDNARAGRTSWVSQISENGVVIDGHGDIATFQEAKELAMNTLDRLLTPPTT